MYILLQYNADFITINFHTTCFWNGETLKTLKTFIVHHYFSYSVFVVFPYDTEYFPLKFFEKLSLNGAF